LACFIDIKKHVPIVTLIDGQRYATLMTNSNSMAAVAVSSTAMAAFAATSTVLAAVTAASVANGGDLGVSDRDNGEVRRTKLLGSV
jgi:hypothetical protein